MLTKSNYHEWSRDEGKAASVPICHLWDAVRVGGVSYNEDRRALEAMCAFVPTNVTASIANKTTVKLAWDATALRRIRGGRVRRATLQQLRAEWEALAF